MSSETKFHPGLAPLSWLFGTWRSIEAVVSFPTIDTVHFTERLEITPTEQDVLCVANYNSTTWKDCPAKTELHVERGFIKVETESQTISLITSHQFGLAEISKGTLGDHEITFESQSLVQPDPPGCVLVKKFVRKLKLDGDTLYSTSFMETATTKFQKHLEAKYKREKTP